MPALIKFYAGEGQVVNDLAGLGLGFYGPGGYNSAIPVGQYQDNTFITNGNGTSTTPIKVDNVKYISATQGELAGADVRDLVNIPNYLATLNIRFTNDTGVKVQNAQLRIFDRSNPDNPAVGVTTKVAVIIHPGETNTADGAGSETWHTPGGSASVVNMNDFPLAISPGTEGASPNGANTIDTRHDWYVAISASPNSIGSKAQYSLRFSLEFL